MLNLHRGEIGIITLSSIEKKAFQIILKLIHFTPFILGKTHCIIFADKV
jgi:hypothetical protein